MAENNDNTSNPESPVIVHIKEPKNDKIDESLVDNEDSESFKCDFNDLTEV